YCCASCHSLSAAYSSFSFSKDSSSSDSCTLSLHDALPISLLSTFIFPKRLTYGAYRGRGYIGRSWKTMAVAIGRLSNYYMSQIDRTNISAYENVQRYIELVELYRTMQKQVKQDGPSVEIVNGQQSYIKSHPLISDMKNINAQLINLKKDIEKHIEQYKKELEAEQKSNKKVQRKGLLEA